MDIVLPYIGSKKRLFGVIKENLPDHNLYIEPFSGGFSLGLSLIESGLVRYALLNDLDPKVASFWACLKDNYWELVSSIDNLISLHGENFITNGAEYTKDLFEQSATDRMSESALFYVYRKMNRGKASTQITDRLQFGTMAYTEVFMEAARLLENVQISNQSFHDLFEFDHDKTFWYLDPPYFAYGRMNFYSGEQGDGFDHIGLRDFCRALRGKFILSYDDCDYIRSLYDGFHVRTIKVPSMMSLSGYSDEVLISNYPLTSVEIGLTRRGERYKAFVDEVLEPSAFTLEDMLSEDE